MAQASIGNVSARPSDTCTVSAKPPDLQIESFNVGLTSGHVKDGNKYLYTFTKDFINDLREILHVARRACFSVNSEAKRKTTLLTRISSRDSWRDSTHYDHGEGPDTWRDSTHCDHGEGPDDSPWLDSSWRESTWRDSTWRDFTWRIAGAVNRANAPSIHRDQRATTCP